MSGTRQPRAVPRLIPRLPVPHGRAPCPTCHGQGVVLDDEELGARCRGRRLEARLSIAQIGARMAVSRGYLSQLELGQRRWTNDLLVRYIAACEGTVGPAEAAPTIADLD